MKNKKSVFAVSAIMIAIFHLCVCLSAPNSAFYKTETFIRYSFFIGVDMFFFMSAYSMGVREIESYGKFIASRFKFVYLKYVVFAVAALIYGKWKLSRLGLVLIGAEFFQKGGGSFLWFIPAIMILYLLIPFYKKAEAKWRVVTPILTVLVWAAFGLLITAFTKYKQIFIFWNRLPAFFLGYYCARYNLIDKLRQKKVLFPILGVVLYVGGILLFRFTAYQPPLVKPIYDLFYVAALPATFGALMLSDLIPSCRVIDEIGSSTMEMYGLQMVFGFDFANFLYTKTKSPIITDIVVLIVLIAASIALRMLFDLVLRRKKKGQKV